MDSGATGLKLSLSIPLKDKLHGHRDAEDILGMADDVRQHSEVFLQTKNVGDNGLRRPLHHCRSVDRLRVPPISPMLIGLNDDRYKETECRWEETFSLAFGRSSRGLIPDRHLIEIADFLQKTVREEFFSRKRDN